MNYGKADKYHWGQNLGCDFVTKSCMHWMSLRKQRFDDIFLTETIGLVIK